MRKNINNPFVFPVQKKFALPLDLQMFADGEGDGGDSGSGNGGEGGDGNGANNNGNNGNAGGGGNQPFATFNTKTELDVRLERAERKGQKELAKSLGFDSVEAMQEAIKKVNGQSSSSDGGNGDDGGEDIEARVKAQVEEQLKTEREKNFNRLVNAKAEAVAAQMDFENAEAVLKLADFSEVKEDPETGKIVGVEDALKKLAEDMPFLLKKKPQVVGSHIPNNNNNPVIGYDAGKSIAELRNQQNKK